MGAKDVFFIIMMCIVVIIVYKITRIKIDNYLHQDTLAMIQEQNAKDEQMSLQIEALQFAVGHEDELREERVMGAKTHRQISPQPCKGNFGRRIKVYNI